MRVGGRLNQFVGILLAILVLSIIVMVHEFGHLIFAKINGIMVEEFAIGMGPKLLKKKIGETEYSIRAFPIGGICKVLGEDEKVDDNRSFTSKPVWARIQVIFGGPLFNFLLAFVISIIYIAVTGSYSTTIERVIPGSAAEEAGLQPGDKIVGINDHHILAYDEIRIYVSENPGSEIELTYKRDSQKYTINITPKYNEEVGGYLIGFNPKIANTKNVFQLIKYAGINTVLWIKMVFYSFSMLISGAVSPAELSGPVGIFAVTSEGYQTYAKLGFGAVMNFIMFLTIFLSANLGVMNLLPIPALDGGRLIFLLFEAVRGKPVDPDKESIVHFAGFVFLMLVMVLVMFNDIKKLFN